MHPRTLLRHTALAALPLFAACASVPKPLTGDFAPVTANAIADSGRNGDLVRWGGVVVDVEPEAERTCLQILSRPLSDVARPRDRDRDVSEGRFLACRAGFYDPEVFTKGREVTITGRVVGSAERSVGEYRYLMPEVAAEVIYLWPERPEYDRFHASYGFGYGFGPFHDPWWPRRGWYGGYYDRLPVKAAEQAPSAEPRKP